MNSIAELIVVIGGTIGVAVPFGLYIARMISYEMRPLEAPLARVENGFYKIIGIDKNKQMTWKEYIVALIITNAIVGVFIFFMFLFQGYIPSTPHMNGLSIDLAFMQTISFITNTNLQHYAGEQSLTLTTQMVALTFAMFVAPASAMAAAFAFIRSFIRKNFGLGNFYVDFIRIILTFLLPIAFCSALLLMVLGVPAMFITSNPKLAALNVMQLHSPATAILATLIFNAIMIPALIPLSLRGVTFRPEPPEKTFIRNILIYGAGGVALPFIGIKAIDLLLALFMR